MSDQVQATPAPSEAPASTEASNQETVQNLEATEEGEESSDDSTSSQEQTKEQAKIAKKIKQLKLKIDGKEVSEDLPFKIDENPEVVEYMTKQLQLAKAAQKRMSEASDYKKKLDQVSDYLSQAKGNPKKIRELMKDLDVDEKQLAAMIVEDELERAKKSPEQLEKERLESELQKIREEREKEKKEMEDQKYQLLVQQYQEKFQQGFEKGLEKAGLPDNDYFRKRVVDYMQSALDKGRDVEIADVVPFIKEEMFSELKSMFSVMPEETLETLLGDNIKRLRKRNLAKAKEVPAVPLNKAVVDTGSKAEPKKEEKISFKDYFKNL